MKYTLLLLIVLVSCINTTTKKKPIYDARIEKSYYMWLKNTDPTFTSHFPDKLVGHTIYEFGWSVDVSYNDYPKSWLIADVRAKNLNDILLFAETSYVRLEPNDSNLLVINNWRLLKESGFSVARNDSTTKKLLELGESEYPVPNFHQFDLAGKDNNACQLSNDFKLFVISAEKGLFFDFPTTDRAYVPPQWEHGFSTGIAISKNQNIVLYWSAIW